VKKLETKEKQKNMKEPTKQIEGTTYYFDSDTDYIIS
jgi:hypothetical protein